MRTIKLPDLTAHIEDDTYLETAIRKELEIDAECVFEFQLTVSDYHLKRFTDVANKVNFWLKAHNRPGSVKVVLYIEATPEPVAPTPEPVVEAQPEIAAEEAIAVEEEPVITSKKKKNG